MSLVTRVVVVSALLAVLVASVFAVLLLAASALREATSREERSKQVTAATLVLERRVFDLETSLRGIVITGNPSFVQPWEEARRELPLQLAALERLVADDPEQRRRAQVLTTLVRNYENDYAVPLVAIAQEAPAAARSTVATAEGKRRMDVIRERFSSFLAAENALAAADAEAANSQSKRAIQVGLAGLALSAALIVVFGVYLARSIARPVRGVAAGASRLAGGELSLRLRETGPGEVGELTRSFNAMAEALERSKDESEAQNAELRESERLKSDLVSIVSHELRTPLTSVLGFTSLLLQRDFDDSARRHYLGIIDAEGRRLAGLLDDFLDVQRIEEGRLELAKQRIDMAKLLRDQAQLFVGQSARHRLQLDLAEPTLPVVGDRDRLAQVVGNLLSNAIKYSPDGGVVAVIGERAGNAVRVRVRDEGLGVPDDQQPQIFTKFFRGDAAASGISGTGLGLAVSREIVEAHGGRIGFTSKAGKGSTFWLELPTAGVEAG
ncbi:MAG: ATP-binding protein [Gaiellaceae bacterium]